MGLWDPGRAFRMEPRCRLLLMHTRRGAAVCWTNSRFGPVAAVCKYVDGSTGRPGGSTRVVGTRETRDENQRAWSFRGVYAVCTQHIPS